MNLSARNVLKGTVQEIHAGAVNMEVVLRLADGVEVVAIITKTACDRPGLTVGKPACAVIKASNVMVAVD